MDAAYQRLRAVARELAAKQTPPRFYRDHPDALRTSRAFLTADAAVADIYAYVRDHADDRLGHGLHHAEKVCLDAGALAIAEAQLTLPLNAAGAVVVRNAQCAGLLHDIRRQQQNHAERGADHADAVLRQRGFSAMERVHICTAIRNHVAFKPLIDIDDTDGILISNCLYDADKFRWGPDNFTHTVWDMVDAANIPPAAFARRYLPALKQLAGIKRSFRSTAGRRYGPEFIDLGLAIGNALQPHVDRLL